ncbi:MAG: recombinase family protein [Clostridiales bacterium]|nr:recombinase family protein [Clostridiales bacterium]
MTKRVINQVMPGPANPTARKRVAAYARVSSGKDAMLHSLSAQVSYYSNYIQRNPKWLYVGVFVDEAYTGTKDNRPEFQRLLTDCRNGAVDMIITKSISRFARNTVTLLETVRELKLLGIGVFFEEQNILSTSGDGELMLTILASFAQEESYSVSENCKWRIRKQFKEGKTTHINILGYRLVDGTLQVVPEEAEIVRRIFRDYLSGLGKQAIANRLNEEGFKSRLGCEWHQSAIHKMLQNEKYVGDLVLQKTYVADHISKKKCINRGELPMYMVEDDHEPIIDRVTYEAVQSEIRRRAKQHRKDSDVPVTYPFTGKLVCSTCCGNFRRKTTAAGTKYEKPVWICTTFNTRGNAACASRQVPEDILKAVTADVLGTANFDEILFIKSVKHIDIVFPDTLIFQMSDGSVVTRTWRHRSRSESWSEEAREVARQKSLERMNSLCQQEKR